MLLVARIVLPRWIRLPATAAALACAGFASAQAADAAQAGRYYEDALVRYEKHDFEGTVLQLKNALQIDSKMLQAQLLLGKALLQSGDVAASEVALKEALRLGVSRSEVVEPLARALAAQGRQGELLNSQQFALAGLSPGLQARMLLLKSAASSDLGDPKGALRTIEEARAMDPGSIDAWLAEVPVRIRARQFKEAQTALDRARAIDPNSAELHYQQGSLLHVMGNLDAALSAYDKALARLSTHVDARVARAGIYVDLKRDDAAAKDVESLLALQPDDARGWYLNAVLAERGGRPQEVKSALTEITALLDPVPIEYIRYRPQILLLAGQAHYGLGELEKAKPFFESFQRLQPHSPVTKLLANIYIDQRNYDSAVESLETYLRSFPNDAQAMALLASAHMAKGRHARAASLMQEALKGKDAAELYTAYGLSLIGIGQPGNAVSQFEAAYKKDPGQTRAGYALVGLYLRDNQIQKALAVAQSLVARQPSNPSFQDLLGVTKVRSNDLNGARAAFEQAIKLDSRLPTAQINLARLETAAGKFDRAESLINSVLSADDRNTDAMFEAARLAERRGKPDDALRWLAKAFDVAGSKDLRSALALVDLHMRKGRRAEALKVAVKVASDRPDDLAAHLALARIQLSNSDAASARSALTTATRLAGFDAAVQVEIALLQLAAGNAAGSAYCLDKALSTKEDYFPALVLMAEVQTKLGDFGKAEQRAQQVIRADPKLPIGYSLLGDLAIARNQPAAALAAYRKAHQVKPSSQTLLALFGTQTLSDPTGAGDLSEQWLKAHPQDASVRLVVAETHVRSGNLQAARKDYEKLLQLLPNDAAVLNNLANVLIRLGDPRASSVADQALTMAPSNPTMIDTAGWAAFNAGKLDRSIQLLRDARLRNPENPEIRYHLAAALAKSGRGTEAREELRAAVGSSAKFESRKDAEALLGTLK